MTPRALCLSPPSALLVLLCAAFVTQVVSETSAPAAHVAAGQDPVMPMSPQLTAAQTTAQDDGAGGVAAVGPLTAPMEPEALVALPRPDLRVPVGEPILVVDSSPHLTDGRDRDHGGPTITTGPAKEGTVPVVVKATSKARTRKNSTPRATSRRAVAGPMAAPHTKLAQIDSRAAKGAATGAAAAPQAGLDSERGDSPKSPGPVRSQKDTKGCTLWDFFTLTVTVPASPLLNATLANKGQGSPFFVNFTAVVEVRLAPAATGEPHRHWQPEGMNVTWTPQPQAAIGPGSEKSNSSTVQVLVPGFYDGVEAGEHVYRVRVYCGWAGEYAVTTASTVADMTGIETRYGQCTAVWHHWHSA